MVKQYSREEVYNSTLEYFKGDTLATNTFINKYCLKDSLGNLYELNPDEMHRRMAKELARIEAKYHNPISEEEIYNLLKDFKYIVPGGSPMAGIGNNLQTTSLSNCFVIGNEADSYGGIFLLDQQQCQLMKRRGGVGFDLSHIRPKGSKVNNSALVSTGVVPFMERFSNSTREVAQDGRRGALLESISCIHPDAEDFIDAKMEEGKVTGANISVKITDEFIRCVLEDKPFTQQFPIDSKTPYVTKQINARKLWKKIIHNAWKRAEPGILFWDTIINESVPDCYADLGLKTLSTNPCIIGSSLIELSNGKTISIKQLTEKGKDILLKSVNIETREIEVKYGRNPRKTGEQSEVWKLILENGFELIATPNHKILLDDLSYKEIKNIKIGDRLFSSIKGKELVVKNNYFFGYDDVYNITVDDNHNYFVTDNNGTNICVKNCGEITLSGFASCILTSNNLYSYVINPFTKDSYFDFELFSKNVRIGQRIMDDIVELEIEKVDAILEKVNNDKEDEFVKLIEKDLWNKVREKLTISRRTGFGITALGDMLAALGYIYGSDESIQFAEKVQKTLAINAYKSSCILGKERGNFPIFDYNREINNPFLNRLSNEDEELKQLLKEGRRNVALLTIAPVGTGSLMTHTTSGIESSFKILYKRRRKVNPNDKDAVITFTDKMGDSWEEYIVFHDKFIIWLEANGYNLDEVKKYNDDQLKELIKLSPYYKATSEDVNWEKKVELQGKLQLWVDHSISVTTNLPENISEDMVAKVYETGWKSGCKGITVYREGSREGVLLSIIKKEDEFIQHDAPKRPKELPADYYYTSAKGSKYAVIIGLFKDKPYELFAFENPTIKENCKGKIVKIKRGHYNFESECGNIENIHLAAELVEERAHTVFISMLLRHGVNIKHITNTITKVNENIVSFSSAICRVLSKYLPKEVTSEICPSCGSPIIFEEGCKKCSRELDPNCTWAKCG